MAKVDLLIDADPMVYAAGFASERREHVIVWKDAVMQDGQVCSWLHRKARFTAGWRKERFIELLNLHPDELEHVSIVIPQPLEFAMQALKTCVRSAKDKARDFLYEQGHSLGRTKMFITDSKSNYRIELATIRPYKGNRQAGKPFWYEELRDALIEWGAELCVGYEADDACAAHSVEAARVGRKACIVSIDKDMNQIAGLHFNPDRNEGYRVSVPRAKLNFYRQLLTGDATDNIPGCFKIGEAKAAELLPHSQMTEREMYDVVHSAYCENAARYPEHHGIKPGFDFVHALVDNARLLYLQRSFDGLKTPKLWVPPR